jgi:TfoX/Sxy family transcriptional regulator of competence genes
MKWSPPPDELVAIFNAVLPVDPRVHPRKMFGYPCCFVGGHMFMGLFQDQMMVRLASGDREQLMAKGGSIFEPMPGKPMKEYVVVPPSVLENQNALRDWVARSLAYGGSLPAKEEEVAKAKPPAKVKAKPLNIEPTLGAKKGRG